MPFDPYLKEEGAPRRVIQEPFVRDRDDSIRLESPGVHPSPGDILETSLHPRYWLDLAVRRKGALTREFVFDDGMGVVVAEAHLALCK